MMLTKEERHELYKKALKIVRKQGWGHAGFCWALSACGGQYSTQNYPEIEKHKPENFYTAFHWFERFNKKDKKREKILRQAINETKPNGVSKRRRVKKRASLPSIRKRNSSKLGVVRRVKKKSKAS